MEYIENAQPLSIPTKSQFCGVKFEGKDVLGVFKQVFLKSFLEWIQSCFSILTNFVFLLAYISI